MAATLAATLLCSPQVSCAQESSEKMTIAHVMGAVWDKPDSSLKVDPIVIESDYAVVGWKQGDMGGRALLKKNADHWAIVLCSGDALLASDALKSAGVPAKAASVLARSVAEAEGGMDSSRVAQFLKFEGILMMPPEEHHPPQHK